MEASKSPWKASVRQIVVDRGEEGLLAEHEVASVDNEVSLIAGYDGGSTQSRVLLMDPTNDNPSDCLSKKYIIPSVCSIVPDDRLISTKGPSVYDRMDSFVTNTSGSLSSLVIKNRVIRGQKMIDCALDEKRLSSSDLKTTDPLYYTNLVDTLGYALIQKYEGKLPKQANIYTCVALPPDDKGPVSIKRLRENLNRYTWIHKPSGAEVRMNITVLDVLTEPEAFVKAYYILRGEEVPPICFHADGGGRSIGLDILRNGESLDAAQKTLRYGGSQLLDNVASQYYTETGEIAPDRKAMETTIKTGLVKDGAGHRDIIDIIKSCKVTMGNQIVSDMIHQVFDQQDQVRLRQVDAITLSGRLMDKGDYNFSVADVIISELKKRTPNSEFVHIEENLIPEGLFIHAFNKYQDLAEQTADETPESEVVAEQQVAASAELQMEDSQDSK